MFTFVITFSIILLSMVSCALAIKTLIDFLKNGKTLAVILLGIIFILGIILDFSKRELFHFSYSFVFSKILFISIFALGFLYHNEKIEIVYTTGLFTFILAICVYLFCGPMIPNIVYDKMPSNVSNHFEQKNIKKEANKLDPEKELSIILSEIKNDGASVSVEEINNRIEEHGYKKYNGIYCYAIDDDGDTWHIGMVKGDSMSKAYEGENFTKPVNFYVSRDSLQIIK